MAIDDMIDSDTEECIECSGAMKIVRNVPLLVACPFKDCGMYRTVLVGKD